LALKIYGPTFSEEHSMSTVTPELRAEIMRHLRATRDNREGMVLRDMERGLTAEQIASSRRTTVDNARNYVRGIADMLSGSLPTTPSLALKASRAYRCLLDCDLSPALRSYVTSCLHRLARINSEIRVEGPFRPGTLRDVGTVAREAAATQKTACSMCLVVHGGECG
jgi:hypothetical protein